MSNILKISLSCTNDKSNGNELQFLIFKLSVVSNEHIYKICVLTVVIPISFTRSPSLEIPYSLFSSLSSSDFSLPSLKKMLFTFSKSGSLARERVNRNRCCIFSCSAALYLAHIHTMANSCASLEQLQ